LVIPATVPVNVGFARGAYVVAAVDDDNLASNAVCVADEIGLLVSDVLSTLDSPTIDLVIPFTVPVKVGESIGALVPRAVVTVEANDASSLIAAASSFKVFSVSGAESIAAATAVVAALSAYVCVAYTVRSGRLSN
jgi:hypothetical protein